MHGLGHTHQNDAKIVHTLLRRIRITSRWLLRRFKQDLRQFDVTIGAGPRATTRRWAEAVRKHGEAEFREFSDDARKRYEKARPEISAWVNHVQELVRSARSNSGGTVRYVLAVATIAVFAFAFVWLPNSTGASTIDNNSADQQTQGPMPEDEAWIDDWDDYSGRTPNDDRSDSMNPNNDAYQSAMDNHANQTNPNNDAYHSSHGR